MQTFRGQAMSNICSDFDSYFAYHAPCSSLMFQDALISLLPPPFGAGPRIYWAHGLLLNSILRPILSVWRTPFREGFGNILPSFSLSESVLTSL